MELYPQLSWVQNKDTHSKKLNIKNQGSTSLHLDFFIVIFLRRVTLFFKLLIMNENVLTDITRNLLGAGYLDLKFLTDTIEEHDLDFDDIYENVEMNF